MWSGDGKAKSEFLTAGFPWGVGKSCTEPKDLERGL